MDGRVCMCLCIWGVDDDVHNNRRYHVWRTGNVVDVAIATAAERDSSHICVERKSNRMLRHIFGIASMSTVNYLLRLSLFIVVMVDITLCNPTTPIPNGQCWSRSRGSSDAVSRRAWMMRWFDAIEFCIYMYIWRPSMAKAELVSKI